VYPDYSAEIAAKMLLHSIQAARKHRSNTFAVFRHLGAVGLFSLAILDSTPLPTFGGPDILIVILVVTHHNPWYECAIAATAGSVIGAYITFRLARRAGHAYLESKFGRRSAPKVLKFFDHWGTGALVASTALPFPLPTSLLFAAAGASNRYSTQTYLGIVAASRAARYTTVAIIGDLYGRHVLRVLRHPARNWGWFLFIAIIFVGLTISGIFINRRVSEANA
jgi:membrane protein YqaA with SNARE-associated domain